MTGMSLAIVPLVSRTCLEVKKKEDRKEGNEIIINSHQTLNISIIITCARAKQENNQPTSIIAYSSNIHSFHIIHLPSFNIKIDREYKR